MCYNQNLNRGGGAMNLNNSPFTFPEQSNKFTVIGFNTFAYMIGTTVSYL